MKGHTMKILLMWMVLMIPGAVAMAQTDPPVTQTREPDLYDHFVAMQQTQERLATLSSEEKERLQPKIRRAELQACRRLQRDQQEGVRQGDYLRQGGEAFVGYVLQFERYCQTLR